MSDSETIEIHIFDSTDQTVFDNIAPGVFDNAIDPQWSTEFLADPRHHLAVALDAGQVVGMVSAVHYVHPDKAPELWINEVGVASSHRGRGIGKKLLQAMFEHGRMLGCREAWVLTEDNNHAARRLFTSAGGEEARRPVYFTFRLEETTQ